MEIAFVPNMSEPTDSTNEADVASQSTDCNAAGEVAPDEVATDLNVYWPVSLCFWCTLLLAAGVYGAVAVAPKLAVWNSVRHQYQQNAQELVALEDEVDYLERVETALQTDPEFLNRLKQPTKATRPGEQSIAISGDLLFGYDGSPVVKPSKPADPPHHGLITALASRRPLRRGLLTLAAGLTIFAFTFLNDAGVGLVAVSGRVVRAAVTMPVRRYVRPDRRPKTKSADEVATSAADGTEQQSDTELD